MIKALWSLKLDGKLVGVRALTTSGVYYDVSIDVYKKQLKLDASSLQPIPLMEYGGLFMTEEEFNTGMLIEDGSNHTRLHKGIVEFVAMSNVNDPIYLAKRRKKAQEYRQKYYTYLPDNWLLDFGNYHFENFEGNNNIYTSLSTEQRELIKEYFRWRSKLIFDENKASKVLRTKLNKAKKLMDLMGNATDWVYDGTVDTGYKGGGYCELGHPLRYEHYAYSWGLKKHIIFGSTCMSDFFELDEAVLKQIINAQEVILKEIKSIIFVMQTDRQAAYSEQYSDLWDVMKHFKGKFNDHLKNGSSWAKFMGGFDKAGLPLTRSMLHKFRELKETQANESVQNDFNLRAKEVMRDLEGVGYPQELIYSTLYDKNELILARILKINLLFKDYSSPFVTKGLKILPDMLTVQTKLKSKLLNKYQFTEKLKKPYPFIYQNGTRRLASKQEVNYSGSQIRYEPYLGKQKTDYVLMLMKHLAYRLPPDINHELPKKMPQYAYDYAFDFTGNITMIEDAVKWGSQDSFLSEIGVFDGVIELPEEVENPVIDKESPLYRYDFIANHLEHLTPLEEKRYNRIMPVEYSLNKEKAFIDNVYFRVLKRSGVVEEAVVQPVPDLKVSEEAPSVPNNKIMGLTETLSEMLDRIEEAGATGKIPQNHFVFKVIPTIRNTGRISDKQKRFIDDALSKI